MLTLASVLLAWLLAFADAVGSPRGLALECLSQLSGLELSVSWDGNNVLLPAGDRHYWSGKDLYVSLGASSVVSVPSSKVKQAVIKQAASATESLLFLAYKLQLPELQQVLATWIRLNSKERGMLSGVMGDVISSRVLAAAASDEQLLRQLVLNSLTKA
jgi:hypothetical protein